MSVFMGAPGAARAGAARGRERASLFGPGQSGQKGQVSGETSNAEGTPETPTAPKTIPEKTTAIMDGLSQEATKLETIINQVVSESKKNEEALRAEISQMAPDYEEGHRIMQEKASEILEHLKAVNNHAQTRLKDLQDLNSRNSEKPAAGREERGKPVSPWGRQIAAAAAAAGLAAVTAYANNPTNALAPT
jgi:hypothetical protein